VHDVAERRAIDRGPERVDRGLHRDGALPQLRPVALDGKQACLLRAKLVHGFIGVFNRLCDLAHVRLEPELRALQQPVNREYVHHLRGRRLGERGESAGGVCVLARATRDTDCSLARVAEELDGLVQRGRANDLEHLETAHENIFERARPAGLAGRRAELDLHKLESLLRRAHAVLGRERLGARVEIGR
jgi:hypothetical protein